jgi:hypothetical protein
LVRDSTYALGLFSPGRDLTLYLGHRSTQINADCCNFIGVRGGWKLEPKSWFERQQGVEKGAEIYGWFGEGWDTPDLQEARGLLEELAACD